MSHVARWRFGRQACFDWCCVVALPIVVEVVRPLITSTRAICSDRLFLPTSWGGRLLLCARVCVLVFLSGRMAQAACFAVRVARWWVGSILLPFRFHAAVKACPVAGPGVWAIFC